MKITVHLLLIIIAKTCVGQQPTTILEEFKKGNMSYVSKYSSVPFTIKGISQDTDTSLLNISYLSTALLKILEVIPVSELKNSKIIKSGKTQYLLEFRTFNEKGELESESTLIFNFKIDNKSYKLTKILLAG